LEPLTIGLVIRNKELVAEAQSALAELPIRILLSQAEIDDWVAFLDTLERTRPDGLLIDLTSLREPFEDVAAKIRGTSANPMLIALHTSTDPETILSAVRAGASEYLYPPLQANLRNALERISGDRGKQYSAARRSRGKTIGFLSAKGGCGATTIICHLAPELARQTGQRVLLADFDLDAGMIGFVMKSKSTYSVLDAVENIHRLDPSFWKALVSNGIPGVEVIAAPTDVNQKEPPKPDQLRHVLRFMRSQYEWTLMDLGRGLNLVSVGAIEDIDETFLITTLEVPALHQAKQIVRTLLNAGYPTSSLHLVLNRMPKRPELLPEEVEKLVGQPVYATVANDYGALYESFAEGKLIDQGTPLGREYSKLASKLSGVQEPSKRRFSIFN
jgi:pilus assembly protein CpaE